MNYTQREKLIDKLCGTGLMLICMEIAYGVICSSFTDYNYNLKDVREIVYIGGGIVLAIAVLLLIYAYIKKNASKASYGMELLVFAFTVAAIPGCYLDFASPWNNLRLVFPVAFFAYYVGKAIYIVKNTNKPNGKQNNKKSNKKKR